jgi:hypothetical protein
MARFCEQVVKSTFAAPKRPSANWGTWTADGTGNAADAAFDSKCRSSDCTECVASRSESNHKWSDHVRKASKENDKRFFGCEGG